MVVAVAEESRGAEHARPWIDAAKSQYWQLIDSEHRLTKLRQYAAVDFDQIPRT